VPNRCPPDAGLIVQAGKPSLVHDQFGHLSPLGVGQHPVSRRRSDRAMPDRLVQPRPEHDGERLRQQPAQTMKVPNSPGPKLWLQFGRITKARDEMRVGVLVRPARPVQVLEQAPRIRATNNLRDHALAVP
jgi:hypothetical protein